MGMELLSSPITTAKKQEGSEGRGGIKRFELLVMDGWIDRRPRACVALLCDQREH